MVNLSRRGGLGAIFQELARLLREISPGQSLMENLRISPANPKEYPIHPKSYTQIYIISDQHICFIPLPLFELFQQCCLSIMVGFLITSKLPLLRYTVNMYYLSSTNSAILLLNGNVISCLNKSYKVLNLATYMFLPVK